MEDMIGRNHSSSDSSEDDSDDESSESDEIASAISLKRLMFPLKNRLCFLSFLVGTHEYLHIT
jgi:hypothetical protein